MKSKQSCTRYIGLNQCATQLLRYHFTTKSKKVLFLCCAVETEHSRETRRFTSNKTGSDCLINYIVNSEGQTVRRLPPQRSTLLNAHQTVIYFPERQAGKPDTPVNSPSSCLVHFFIEISLISIIQSQPVRVHREGADNSVVFVI